MFMTTPTNHTVTLINRFGNSITATVVYLNPLGAGKADVHVETNFYIELGYEHVATYTTPSNEARGRYKAHSKAFTERLTYIYKGTFERTI